MGEFCPAPSLSFTLSRKQLYNICSYSLADSLGYNEKQVTHHIFAACKVNLEKMEKLDGGRDKMCFTEQINIAITTVIH